METMYHSYTYELLHWFVSIYINLCWCVYFILIYIDLRQFTLVRHDGDDDDDDDDDNDDDDDDDDDDDVRCMMYDVWCMMYDV